MRAHTAGGRRLSSRTPSTWTPCRPGPGGRSAPKATGGPLSAPRRDPFAASQTRPPSATPPPLAAAATTAPLTGIWLADYGASTNRSALLTALGLSGLARTTAEKLIEGFDISVSPGNRVLSIRYLSVVPFFQVKEDLPLDGSPTTQTRRDMKKGVQTARLAVVGGDGDGDDDDSDGSTILVVTLTWPAPAPGTLVETYTLSPTNPRELRVQADLWTGGRSPAGSAPPTASATTLYRRQAGWTPRYTFPGGGGGPARRAFLLGAVGTAAAAAPPPTPIPPPAAAFPAFPGTAPPPLKSPFAPVPLPLFPRRSLRLPLAVIFMRSSYDALADTIPSYPMAAFQSSFWMRRSNEWEPYIEARRSAGAAEPRPPQGDLTSAPYFDFISHSQWGALDAALDGAAAMLAAPVEAEAGWADGGGEEDRPGATEVSEEVAASAKAAAAAAGGSASTPLPDPAALRVLLAAAAGDRILRMMREGFQGETFAVPRPPSPTDRMGQVKAAVEALMSEFVRCGYALSATVALDPDTSPRDTGGALIVTVLGPAVLWGCAERAARGVSPNALDALATAALFRAGGVGAILTNVDVTATGITQSWIIGEGPVEVVVGKAPQGQPAGVEDGEGE